MSEMLLSAGLFVTALVGPSTLLEPPVIVPGMSRADVEARLGSKATPCPSFSLGHFGSVGSTVSYEKAKLSVSYDASGKVAKWWWSK